MSYVDALIQEKDRSASVGYAKFMLLTKQIADSNNYIFCFMEGKDAPYYTPRVEYEASQEVIPVVCGGKQAVIDVYKLVQHDSYAKYKKLFFIDKDYDCMEYDENIYTTPCYSVENFYANIRVLQKVMKNEFYILPINEEYCDIINLFNSNINKFNESILEFNAWYICIKKSGIKPNFSINDALSKIVKLQINNIEKQYTINSLNDIFNCNYIIDNIFYNEALEYLKTNMEYNIRGKYELSFFCKFLQFLIRDANHLRQYIKQKISFTLVENNVLGQLSQYADTPESLKTYIQKMIL